MLQEIFISSINLNELDSKIKIREEIIRSYNKIRLQSPNSHQLWDIIIFLEFLNVGLIFILYGVALFMGHISQGVVTNLFVKDNHVLESLWIIFPTLFLLTIAIPSLSILYITDDIVGSSLSLKVRAHQWFWRYEYSNLFPWWSLGEFEFDAYMVPLAEIRRCEFRLLETDHRPVLPYLTDAQALISRTDVLHSWTIPRLGVKADANPGRINHAKLKPISSGVFYGQCSEICGSNHRFIPISLEFTGPEVFIEWIIQNLS